ncbi:DNA-directed RNA polymerase subunit omega [Chitinispirillales bacterium ANBcel5]|uniref:DNA-directed RNA polymerase subunit omega n=1 Tax=Cellulosispirillum alkaliphilum TaxID=3039283 RepID=UPI002A5965B3|nr:DNA-directed RNA polymerase subunit omega [Chitinispirillales bacterium ANBcel5]
MSRDLYELEIEKLEKKGISRYKAVLMASQEARFINDQIRLDIIDTKEKPTTLALKRLFEGSVVENQETEIEG